MQKNNKNNKSSLIANNFELPGAKKHYNTDLNFQTQKINLDLILDFEAKRVFGKSTLELKFVNPEVKKIVLDAVDMDIYEVKLNGQKQDFEYDQVKITLPLIKRFSRSKAFEIEILYQTKATENGLTYVQPDKFEPEKSNQVWSKGEQIGSRYWLPCIDNTQQITPFFLKIRLPQNWTSVSNGVLKASKKLKAGDVIFKAYQKYSKPSKSLQNYKQLKLDTWEMKNPIATYAFAFAAGDFQKITEKYQDIELSYFADKKYDSKTFQKTVAKTPQMMAFYESYFGVKYPFPNYDQVFADDFIWGGMENSGATFNTSKAIIDDKALPNMIFSEVVICHELSHQWFGDLVVINHWKDLWVKEGMATYSESLWWQHEYGQVEFDYYRLNEWREYLAESYKRPVETNIYLHVEDIYDRHSYTKAGTIYHMLRTEMGEKPFKKFLQKLLTKFAYKNVEGSDLVQIAKEVTGKNIKPLLDQYLYTVGHPIFKFNYNFDTDNNLAKIKIDQTQTKKENEHDKIFDLTLPIAFGFKIADLKNKREQNFDKFYTKNGEKIGLKIVSVKIDQLSNDYFFNLKQKPDFVIFDYKNNYLKTAEIELGKKELIAASQFGDDLIWQIFCLQKLVKTKPEQSLKVLQELFEKTDFWGLRLEIISLAAKTNLESAVKILELGLKDSDARVVEQALKVLTKFESEETFKKIEKVVTKKSDLVKLELQDNYFIRHQAIITLAQIAERLGNSNLVKKAQNLSQKQASDSQKSWTDLVQKGGISALASLKSEPETFEILKTYLNFYLDKVSNHKLRIHTISQLGRFAKYQSQAILEKTLDYLEEFATDRFLFTELAVLTSLSQLIHPRSVMLAKQIADWTHHGRMQRKALEVADKISRQIKANQQLLSFEKKLNQLEKHNRKILERIIKLEKKLESV